MEGISREVSMEIEVKDIVSFSGNNISVAHRVGTCDINTYNGICVGDEYGLQKICPSPINVIDIGAYVGAFSLLAASMGAKKVIAVEILPENVSIIKQNIINNKFDNIEIIGKAISDVDGKNLNIYYTPDDTESGKVHHFMGSSIVSNTSPSIVIESISLSNIISRFDNISVLKTDCEGAEWEAFPSVDKSLLNRIDYIVGEIHNYPDKNYSDFYNIFSDMFEDISEVVGGKHENFGLFCFRNRRLSA
jgi:FkbM family methyltransferase